MISLKVGDVDSQRMTLRVEQGKGAKDRYAMLSPVLLQRLRTWWRVGHAQGKILPGGWLFPGMDPTDPLTARQLNRAVHDAAAAAGINKRVTTTTHSLRHYLPFLTMSREGRQHPHAAEDPWPRQPDDDDEVRAPRTRASARGAKTQPDRGVDTWLTLRPPSEGRIARKPA